MIGHPEPTSGRPARPAAQPGPSGFVARHFVDRSGRIIASTRVILAAVFFWALWLDPTQPVRATSTGYSILALYFAWSSILLLVAWRSWWWDFRLARPAHLFDLAVFLAAVYLTEDASDDFTSPFLAFFSFLMLSATIRWDWRSTAVTGLAVTLLYFSVGEAMHASGIEIDIFRFGRRVVYLAVLAIILTWLAQQRRGQMVERFVETPGSAEDSLPPMTDALRYAMTQLGARRGAITWDDSEEPQVQLRVIGFDCPDGRLPPDALSADDAQEPAARLFDRRHGRLLRARENGGCVAETGPVADSLAEHCSLDEGLVIPFSAVTGRGAVMLADIPGACADHVLKAADIAREIGSGFDRHSTLSLARESAMTLMRDTVARDLHDTIAQSLAGAALRLEALRTWIAGGGEPDVEIQSIKSALKVEQAQVRSLINRLRDGQDLTPETAASQCLAPLLADLATYWSVDAALAGSSGRVAVPGSLIHELRQLVREAVANAVRHGGAGRIEVTLDDRNEALLVTIVDNGSGFASAGGSSQPRTISERIHQLGGQLEIISSPRGATLHLHLPRGDGQ